MQAFCMFVCFFVLLFCMRHSLNMLALYEFCVELLDPFGGLNVNNQTGKPGE